MSTALSLAMQITANTEGVSSGIRDVNSKLDAMASAGKRAAADLEVLKTIEISRVFIAAVTTAANSFKSLVGGSASAVAAIDDLSKRTGVSSSALQAYQFAAEQSGVGLETFGKAIQKLTVNLGEAQTGNASAIKSFGELGLSVADLSTLSPQVAFEKVAAAIAELPNPAQQAAAAVSLFGKSGVDLVPVFQEGAGFLAKMREEAERLGTVLSQDQVSGLAALDDAIAKVSAAFKGLTARVVAELAPALTAAANDAATFIGSIDAETVIGKTKDAVAVLSSALQAAGAAFRLIYAVVAPLAATVFPVLARSLTIIADNMRGIALGAGAAAAAYYIYSGAAGTAIVATKALAASIRGLLVSTGIGVLVVVLGAVAGGLVEYALKANEATTTIGDGAEAAETKFDALDAKIQKSIADTEKATEKAALLFQQPAVVTDRELVKGLVGDAERAFQSLARQAGKVQDIPLDARRAYEELAVTIEDVNDGTLDAARGEAAIRFQSQKVLDIVNRINDAHSEEKKRIDDVVDGVKRAQEFEKQRADEKARHIERLAEQENAQLDAIQKRAFEIEALRLEGLMTPNNEALRVSDIRTSEGISQFMALATGREDPAVAEARRQTAELAAMNRKLDELRVEKAEIMGGA